MHSSMLRSFGTIHIKGNPHLNIPLSALQQQEPANLNFLECKLTSSVYLFSFPAFNISSASCLLEISFIFLEIACISVLKGTVSVIKLVVMLKEKSTADLLSVVFLSLSGY